MKKLSKFDEECFEVAINIARETYEAGKLRIWRKVSVPTELKI